MIVDVVYIISIVLMIIDRSVLLYVDYNLYTASSELEDRVTITMIYHYL